MRIAVVAPSPVPFIIGGAEKLFWGLVRNINAYTSHIAELLKIPCRDDEFWSLMEGYRNFLNLDVSSYDLVISTKYPAWMVSHPQHHLYMQHPCRGVYELYQGPVDDTIPHPDLIPLLRLMRRYAPSKELLPEFFERLFALPSKTSIPEEVFTLTSPFSRVVIKWLDSIALHPSYIRSYSAISRTVATREGYFPEGISVKIFHHPSDLEGFREGEYRYLFTVSRLTALKRIDLLIKAFRRLDIDIPFFIAGTGGAEEFLRFIAEGDSRIHFLGFLNDGALINWYSNALFVPFVPYNEDYGLITVEAMHSAKAVLTTTDSGGVNELVSHGENGLSVEPTEESIAEAMAQLIGNREKTIEMGRRAKETVSHITWERFITSFIQHITDHFHDGKRFWAIRGKDHKRILVVNEFSIFPPVSGGKIRLFQIVKALSRRGEVTFLSFTSHSSPFVCRNITPSIKEVLVPKSKEHAEEDERWSSALGVSAQDVSAINSWSLTPSFEELLKTYANSCDLVLLSHPYLIKVLRKHYKGPLWYDAQDVEIDLKAWMFKPSEERDQALRLIREVEATCLSESSLVMPCSDEDAKRLMEIYGVDRDRMVVVPNGVSSDEVFLLTPSERYALRHRLGIDSRPVAIFMGSIHGPNNEAALWICDLAISFPEVLFIIIGSVCNVLKPTTLPFNVMPLGMVSSETKAILLNASHIAMNPVEGGSGTNVKMLEYAAYELPIITTETGNRGLAFRDGKEVIISNKSQWRDRLSEVLEALSSSSEDIRVLGRAAREMALSRYEWSKIIRPIIELL
ncbi:MAG: glycosyltransferase family 4 protein [Syntrophobacterales bacterium]|nr:glycosyltransferase family 4 protein [Syntrophobacterales bacterium]